MSTFFKNRIPEFEEAVYRAFPIQPIPEINGIGKTSFEFQVKKVISGRSWSEVIGRRLNYGEMDIRLTGWLYTYPVNIVRYYLPSHLILATLILSYGAMSNYPIYVMEALILPPSFDQEVLEDIDSEMYLDCKLAEDAEVRFELYKAMNPEQRACVADFLSLYGECKKSEFTARGLALYTKNIEYWRNSSLTI